MYFLAKLAINSISIFFAASFLPGVYVSSYPKAIWVAVVIGLLNVFVKPFLILLTIPITLFTFGIFLLFINAIIISIAARMINGFSVETFWAAFFLSIIIALLNYLMELPAMRQKRNDNQSSSTDHL